MGTGSFPGVKRPGRGVDHPPLSRAEVEGRVELYICSLSGPSWPVLGRILPLPLLHVKLQSHLRQRSHSTIKLSYWKWIDFNSERLGLYVLINKWALKLFIFNTLLVYIRTCLSCLLIYAVLHLYAFTFVINWSSLIMAQEIRNKYKNSYRLWQVSP